MRLTIAYSEIKKRNLMLINNATYQRETLSERPIRQPLTVVCSYWLLLAYERSRVWFPGPLGALCVNFSSSTQFSSLKLWCRGEHNNVADSKIKVYQPAKSHLWRRDVLKQERTLDTVMSPGDTLKSKIEAVPLAYTLYMKRSHSETRLLISVLCSRRIGIKSHIMVVVQ